MLHYLQSFLIYFLRSLFLIDIESKYITIFSIIKEFSYKYLKIFYPHAL